jgi:hypothetical protein
MDRRVKPGDDGGVFGDDSGVWGETALPNLLKLARTLQTRVFDFAVPASWSMPAMPCSIEGVVDRDVG